MNYKNTYELKVYAISKICSKVLIEAKTKDEAEVLFQSMTTAALIANNKDFKNMDIETIKQLDYKMIDDKKIIEAEKI